VSYYNGSTEELMWVRLQDKQREAETRRLLREARQGGSPTGGGRVRRWIATLRA
jgi:hypothetical protein